LGWGKKFTTPARIAISQCGSVASILTLTVSCTAFIVVLQRLEEIEQRLKRIDRKIDQSFYADFRANLKSAQNAFTRKNSACRRAFAIQAVSGFNNAHRDLQRLHSSGI
jgi:biopolymer transport protein ExbB/TolQ